MRVCSRLAVILFGALVWSSAANAQSIVPSERYLFTRDVDFFGADRANLFDTTLEACQRACSSDAECVAFTFNTRSRACFPKSAVNERQPYVGAMSATRITAPDAFIARAEARADTLDVPQADRAAARSLALSIAERHPSTGQPVEALTNAATNAWQTGNHRAALRWTGAAIALTDAPDLWVRYANYALRLNDTVPSSERRRAQQEAVGAALNGYLRAEGAGGQATALVQLARAYERNGRGREMIAPLRLAQTLQARDTTAEFLEASLAKYGFRITDHDVDNNSAAPRICATFSEPLIKAGFDYEPYVRSADQNLVVQVEDRQLCLDGARHGSRYRVTFRSGLPAAGGEVLSKDVEIALYVRDRAPLVRFPGRSYVLARGGAAAVPIETVNVDTVDLTLSRVSDRNLVRALRDDVFGRPLSQWQEREFNDAIGQEIWRGTGTVQGTLNVETRTRLPLQEALADQSAGVYVLSARVPGSDPYEVASATQWFVLSDLGVTTWQGNDGLTAAVRSLTDAKAVTGATVELVSQSNAVLGTVQTDADGFAHFPQGLTRGRGAAAPALMQVRLGEDFVFLPLTDAAFDLSDRGVEGRPPAPPIDVFMTTDRGAYRPGSSIHLTALARSGRALALTGLPITAILYRPDGVEYARVASSGDLAGGHVITLPLAATAPRGTWRIALKSDLEAPALVSQTVLVEDFVPERIDVTLDLPDAPLRLGASASMQASARYLFGAPGADLAVEGELRLERRDTLEEWPGYRFGRHDVAFAARQVFLDGGRTDAEGRTRIPLKWPDVEVDGVLLNAVATVRVSDGAGRPVERSVTRPVNPSGPVIGIRPAFEDVLPEGGEARFDLVAAGTSDPVAARWTVNRVETRYQWYQLFGNWNWDTVTKRTRIAQGDVTLSGEATSISVPTDWGDYEIVVERLNGPYTSSSVDFAAGWYGGADASDTPDRLPVSLDSASYQRGQIATLKMIAPYDGVALVSVLSDAVIERRAVPVTAGENDVSLVVGDGWGTGAYVTASVLRSDARDTFGPTRALGLVHASVDPGEKALAVSLDTLAQIDGQAGELTVNVKVNGLDGAKGYVTLAAVDVGVLNLTGFQAPDPQGHYFGQRRLGVGLRDMYGRLIDAQSGGLGQIRSGGDAANQMQRQSPPPTEAVMAAFSGPVTVDENGTAQITLQRPNFNGTIRLMAVAWSDQGVGQAVHDVLARDPVVMSAALPRFLAPGDTSRLQLEFVHAAGAAGAAQLDVTAQGLAVGQAPARVDLPQDGTVRVTLPVTASGTGDHTINVGLTTPDGTTLTKTLNLGVRENDPVVARTRRLTLAPNTALTMDDNLFADLRPTTAKATVSAGPLARFDMPGLLRQLDRYPYGCTEQVTSAAMPLLYVAQMAEQAGIPGTDARIGTAIARILTRQSSNGAFGLWRAQSGEFWLDAYVTDFLSRARSAGHKIPDTAMQLALDNLRNRVNYAPEFDAGGEDIAYALLVLAREGSASIGDLRYYADAKSTAFATPLARAQLGAALANYGEQARADRMFGLAQDLILSAQGSETKWRTDFGSSLRDTAGVLHLAAEVGSARIDQGDLAARLTTPSRRFSTQEAAQVVMAAHALQSPGAQATLTLNDIEVSGPLVTTRTAGTAPAIIRNISDTPQDITITSYGVPITPPDAGGYGYNITRRSYAMDGTPTDGTWTVGERRVIVLDITPFENIGARLIIDDPLPAGLEIDNPNLLRAGDVRALDWLSPKSTEHSEFRTDRFVAAVDQRDDKAFQLAYIVRAVSPGEFHHPAALVEDMYRPEYRAITATTRIQVVE